jgi:hypothetical protein
MGRKKNRTGLESKTPGSAPAQKGGAAQAGDKKAGGASPRTVLSMGLGGGFLGFLSGLNQWPQLPAELNSVEASAAWLGAVLGVQHLDWNSAAQGGFLGLAVGLGFATSFNFGLRKMMMTWLLAGGGLLAGALLIKTATAAAGGWILGWMMATPLRND